MLESHLRALVGCAKEPGRVVGAGFSRLKPVATGRAEKYDKIGSKGNTRSARR